MSKVFPLGQASLLFKKQKTLVIIWLRYIIEMQSRQYFFGPNSWNLFFFLIILICLTYNLLCWGKKKSQMEKKRTSLVSTYSVSSMQ